MTGKGIHEDSPWTDNITPLLDKNLISNQYYPLVYLPNIMTTIYSLNFFGSLNLQLYLKEIAIKIKTITIGWLLYDDIK